MQNLRPPLVPAFFSKYASLRARIGFGYKRLSSRNIDKRRRTEPRFLVVSLLFGAVLLSACQTEEKKGIDLAALLNDSPSGSYVEGVASGLGEAEILNDKDFIYALSFNDKGDEIAWVHHVTTQMEVSSTSLALSAPRFSGTPKFQVKGNASEFDIEDILFSQADNTKAATLIFPSRQGIVRQLSSSDGSLIREMTLGVPLVRVALNPSRTLLAVGSVTGQITLFDPVDLSIRGSARLHTDELQGLVFVDDTHILSGGFDKELVLSEVKLESPEKTSLISSMLPTGENVFIAHLDGTKALPTVRDGRQSFVVITSTAVKRLKLPPVPGKEQLVRTALGVRSSPVVDLGELRISTLTFGNVHAAICDVCVPIGAELLLGKSTMSRAVFLDDVANEMIVLQPGKTVEVSAAGAEGLPPMDSPTSDKNTPAPATDSSVTTEEIGTDVNEGEESVAENVAETTPPVEKSAEVPAKPSVVAPAEFLKTTVILVEKKRITAPGFVTDLNLNASRRTAILTYSHGKAARNPDIYEAEKNNTLPPPNATSAAVLVDTKDLSFGKRFVGHRGFTVTGALSPDGKTLATGGWDKHTMVYDVESGKLIHDEEMAWLVRRIRFSPDGRSLAVATWTPANPFDDTTSEPALLLYPVIYDEAKTHSDAKR
ncbi:MAG: hypothetical protein GY822_20610 [Deltaproteobacteria bacterium]|nr:hypothetical protein [Deltaproteobacteria bacterium]